MRTILLDGRIDWDDILPEAWERWQTALKLWNRYTLHRTGITYAMQGYHCGDGVSVYADVIEAHIQIEEIRLEILNSPEYKRKHGKDRHGDEYA